MIATSPAAHFAAAPRGGFTTPADSQLNPDLVLVETVLFEVHELAVQTALVASTLNTLRLAQPADIALIEGHWPVDSGVGDIVSRLGQRRQIPAPTAGAVSKFLAALPLARHLADEFLASRTIAGGDVSRAWQAVCRLAKTAVAAMDDVRDASLPAFYRHNSQIVLGMLGRCAAGGFPCLDLHGKPLYPALPHRRRSLRYPLLQYCRVVCGALEFEAVAKDISSGGMGLLKAHGLNLHDPVEVELSSGQRFAGTIAWTTADGAAGVSFDAELAADHPLIASR